MAALTVQNCKDYLRIQSTAEDAMLATWLAMVTAAVAVELGRPIATVTAQEWEDRVENNHMYHSVRNLVVPPENSPFDPATLTIEDVDALTLSSTTDYYAAVTGLEGTIRARPGMSFSNGPYTLTADVGLETRSDYSTVVEPVINMAILDTVADWYQRRNPNATSESTGGGVSTSYSVTQGLSARAKELLDPYRAVRIT